MPTIIFNVQLSNLVASEITQIAAIKLNDELQMIDTFSSFVKPNRAISKETEELTNITNADVESAPPFETAIDDFYNWCGKRNKFVSWTVNDLLHIKRESAFKQHQNKNFFKLLYNHTSLQETVQKLHDIKLPISLVKAMELYDLPYNGVRYNAEHTVINVMHLFWKIKSENDS